MRDHSLVVLDMPAAQFAHGGEVLAGMYSLIQRERWAPRVMWREWTAQGMVQMM